MTLSEHTQEACNAILGTTLVVDGKMGPISQDAVQTLLTKIKTIFTTNNFTWNANNLIGIRMSDIFTDAFTDFGVITIGNGLYAFPISTKPGSFYLAKPENKAGCACLMEGNYPKMWQFHDVVGGWTGDPYCAQITACNVLRQLGKKTGDSIDRSVTPDHGIFGINFHTWKNFNGAKVYNLSAGCNVMQEGTELEILEYLKTYFKEPITYTLLHFKDFA